MKYSKLILFVLLNIFIYGQYYPSLGPDQFLPCNVGSTTLTADLSQYGQSNTPNQTTNYTVSQIPYNAPINTGTQITQFFSFGFLNNDDGVSNAIPLPFTFSFYGQTYNQFWVGSNGWISFSANQPTNFASTTIPSTSSSAPKNCIMGPWQDWHPGISGEVKYQVQGVAPCRKLVVSWLNIPMYSCTNLQGTFHIVIYESTNYIETFIQDKLNCLQWAGGNAVHGIHNALGTQAVTVAGRNSQQWTAQQDARRWTPSGAPILPTLSWYQVGNPIPIAQNVNQITIIPPVGGAYYTCHLEYPIGNAGWLTCNGVGLDPDTILIQPGILLSQPPNIQHTNPTCYNFCDGSITTTITNGASPVTYSWNTGQNTPNISNLCDGIYILTITDSNGCSTSTSVTLTNPSQVLLGNIISLDTICYLTTNEPYSVPDLGYNYNWSSVGNIISGQGTNNINIDWSLLPAGFIQEAVSVTALDQNGCASIPQNVDVFILNILPTIDSIAPLCDYSNCVTLNSSPLGGTFTGNGLNENMFCPFNALAGNNIITYSYIQSNCIFDTTINIIVYPRPTISQIQNNLGDLNSEFIELCESDSVIRIYDAISPEGGNIVWILNQDSITNPNLPITWNNQGIYTFSAISYLNGCASHPVSYLTTIEKCPEELIYVPNTFTPDGNEHNNTFSPVLSYGFDLQDFHLTIYNRWGEIVWESFDSKAQWDGTYNNKNCQDGTYSWVITYHITKDAYAKTIYGHVNLIR